MTRQTPVSRTPWFFSLSSCLIVGTYTSIRSGTLRTIRTAQRAACQQKWNTMKLHTYVIEISFFLRIKEAVQVSGRCHLTKGGGGSNVPFPFLMNDTLNHAYPLYIHSGSQKLYYFSFQVALLSQTTAICSKSVPQSYLSNDIGIRGL